MLGQRLLLIVSERIGDVIFCTPAIQLLKQRLPNATINVLAPSAGAGSVLMHNPAINHIYTSPDKATLKKLSREHDTIIDLHNSKLTRRYSSLLKLPAHASPRIRAGGHQSAVATEFITSLLQCASPQPCSYLLYPQTAHFQKAEQLLAQAGVNINEDILIGCHIGCSQITRRGWKIWKKTDNHKSWPVENFKSLEQKLRYENAKIRFILTGSSSESYLCQQIR